MSSSFHKQPNRRAHWRVLALFLGMFGLWSWLTESAIQAFVLNFIEAHFDVYYPDLTGLTITVVLAGIGLYMASRAPYVHEFELPYVDLVKKLKFKFISLSVSVVLCVAGGYVLHKLYQLAPTADQEPLVIDLSGSDIPDFLWLRKIAFNGAALSSQVSFSKDTRETSKYKLRRYTPIISAEDSGQKIQFVESYTSNSTAQHKKRKAKLEGFVSLRPLPAAIRVGFERNGLNFGSPVYVVESALFDVAPYLKWASIFVFSIALILLIRLLLSPVLHKRKLQTAWDHQRGYSKGKDVGKDLWPWSDGK